LKILPKTGPLGLGFRFRTSFSSEQVASLTFNDENETVDETTQDFCEQWQQNSQDLTSAAVIQQAASEVARTASLDEKLATFLENDNEEMDDTLTSNSNNAGNIQYPLWFCIACHFLIFI